MGQMLKSLRKFNKNVFVYVSYPPPLSYPKGRGYLAVCVLTGKGAN